MMCKQSICVVDEFHLYRKEKGKFERVVGLLGFRVYFSNLVYKDLFDIK